MAFFRTDSRLFGKDLAGWRSAAMWCRNCGHLWDAKFHRLAEVDIECPVCDAKYPVPPMRTWRRNV